MNIECTSTPASPDIDFLTQKINEEMPEFGAAYPFAFFIRSACAIYLRQGFVGQIHIDI